MTDLQTLFLCCVAFAVLAVFSLFMWAGTKRREILLRAENAELRSQINRRGAGGKFTKKTPAE